MKRLGKFCTGWRDACSVRWKGGGQGNFPSLVFPAFEEKMPRLVAELERQFAEGRELETAIKANLSKVGYAG